MRTLLLAIALAVPAAAPAADQAPTASTAAPTAAAAPSAAPAAAAPADPQALEKKLMAERAELIAKNLPLTADQAARFWPLYAKYQAGFQELLSQQVVLVKRYLATYEKLDDAGALQLASGQLDRDVKVAAYRVKWFPEFQKVLPGKLAARFMQIDRRLGLITQMQLISQIPIIQ